MEDFDDLNQAMAQSGIDFKLRKIGRCFEYFYPMVLVLPSDFIEFLIDI